MKSKKILVTGSSGFIGRAIMGSFGERAIGLNRSASQTTDRNFICDLANTSDVKATAKQLERYTFTHLIHAAAATPWSNNPDFSIDIKMAKSAVRLCEALNIPKIIFISGWNVYDMSGSPPFSETTTVRPVGEYGTSKYEVEKYLFSSSKNTHVISLRAASIYGVGQTSSGLITNLVKSAFDAHKITINNPHTKRDYLCVDDFIGVIRQLTSTKHLVSSKALNIGSGRSVSVVEVAETIKDIFKSIYDVDIEIVEPVSSHVDSLIDNQLDIESARNNGLLLDVKSLRDGLSDYIVWRKNENIFRP